MKPIIVIFCILLSVKGIAQKNAYYQQSAKYKMEIDVDVPNFTYQGKQTISYTNNSPDELREVYFHLYWNAFRANSMMDQRVQSQGKEGDKRLQQDGISRLVSIPLDEQGAQNIHWIKQNGKDLKFEIQETIMKVYLATPLKPYASTTFSMEWDAVIPQQIRRSGRNNKEGIDMTMTQWYPKLVEYDYDGWATFDYIGREFHSTFSDFDIDIKIDSEYVIGAGGVLQNPSQVRGYDAKADIKTDKNGKSTWKWSAQNILDFAWAADKDYTVESFTILDGPKIYLVYQKEADTLLWEQTPPYITKFFELMNASYGKYPYPTYSFVQGGDGGMEYGMTTMIVGRHKNLESLCGLMFHEGAHSWFQQVLASNESMYPWLDEGFTSYAEDMVMSRLFPSQNPLPNPFYEAIGRYVKFVKTGKETPAVWLGDHHDSGNAYSFASYVKGETYLIQLGYIMGEQKLSEVLKSYFEEWKLKHPAPRDFLHTAQRISNMDLKWFHHYWINTTKTIDYSIKNIAYGEQNTIITLENKGGVPMPIDFGILTTDQKIVTYHIPLNAMRTWKQKDIYGSFSTLDAWPWTQREYTFSIPYTKAQLKTLGIDFSQRLADINPEDNFVQAE